MYKVIMCYSYKGGTGRTLGAVNIACYLALAGKNVALIDLDYEAPSIPIFFYEREELDNLVKGEKDETMIFPQNWIQDYLRNPIPKEGSFEYLVPPPIRLEEYLKGGIINVTERLNNKYKHRIEKGIPEDVSFLLLLAHPEIKRSLTFTGEGVIDRLKRLFSALEKNYKTEYIIIDSASGIRPSTLPPLMVADLLLVFFRFSMQQYIGTLNILQYIKMLQDKKKIKLELWLVPSNVPDEAKLTPEQKEDFIFLKDFIFERLAKESLLSKDDIASLIIKEEFYLRWRELKIPFEGAAIYEIEDPGYNRVAKSVMKWKEGIND